MSGKSVVIKEVRKPLKSENDFVCLQQIFFDYNNGEPLAGPMFRFIRRDINPPYHMKAQRSGCFFYDLDTILELLNAMKEELQWHNARTIRGEVQPSFITLSDEKSTNG